MLQERKIENLRLIRNKLASCLTGLTNSNDFHVFTCNDYEGNANGYTLIFATNKEYKALKSLEALANKHGIIIYGFSYCGEDTHPKSNRHGIFLSEKHGLPESFDSFMTEVMTLLVSLNLISLPTKHPLIATNGPAVFSEGATIKIEDQRTSLRLK